MADRRFHTRVKLRNPQQGDDPDDAVTAAWVREHAGEGPGPDGGSKLAWRGFIGAPPPGSLEPLELGLEYDAEPNPRIWVGVPLSVDSTGRRVLYPPFTMPPGEGGTIWDDGTTVWDVELGGTLWDIPTVWNDNGVITIWDNGNTVWDG